MPPARATIADVAREAGVSLATVSRVLNDKAEGVGAATRQRVKDVMGHLGYAPCGVARGLATGRSRTVGLIVPDIADPFFPRTIKGAEDVLRRLGYGVLLCDSDRDPAKEAEHVRILLEKRVDGVILNSAWSDDAGAVGELERHGVPYVLLDRQVAARPSAPGVHPDNRRGAALAAGHLLDHGVRALAYIGGPAGLTFSAQRREGVQDALGRRRPGTISLVEVAGDLTMEGGERAMDTLLGARRRPALDGVFAANDRMAIGALRALRRRGLRVPDDVQVMGFDDIEAAAWLEPPLSTVALPAFEMGRRAAELLLRLAGGERPRRRTLMLEPSLVLRGTTRERSHALRSAQGGRA